MHSDTQAAAETGPADVAIAAVPGEARDRDGAPRGVPRRPVHDGVPEARSQAAPRRGDGNDLLGPVTTD